MSWFKKIPKLSYILAIVVAVSVALFIRSQVIEPFKISSNVMRPALETGDTVFVAKTGSKLSLVTSQVKVGDVVLFRSDSSPYRDFIKRVVGLPGDDVEVLSGRIIVNGIKKTADEIDSEACSKEHFNPSKPDRTYQVCIERPIIENYPKSKVPAGKVFVLGDLRTRNVTDLRKDITWGMIPSSTIKGKALWVWLSFEPRSPGGSDWFPRMRFERMFKPILSE